MKDEIYTHLKKLVVEVGVMGVESSNEINWKLYNGEVDVEEIYIILNELVNEREDIKSIVHKPVEDKYDRLRFYYHP